jgi:hypothetical protein
MPLLRRRKRRGRPRSASRASRAEQPTREQPVFDEMPAFDMSLPPAISIPSMPVFMPEDIDVPTTDEYYDNLVEEWGVELAGGSAALDEGGFGAVFIGATPSGRVIGRAIGSTREGAERDALELVRDGALDTAELNPVVRSAMKGLRKLLRRRAGNRRPRQVEDDEALDLVGLARWAEELRCRPSR